jgi:hypothetical protein
MSDNAIPAPPTDPFAGRPAENAAPPPDGAEMIRASWEQNGQAQALLAEAQQLVAGLKSRVPVVRGNKGFGAVLSVMGSIEHDLARAMAYQKELAAYLPPIPPAEPKPTEPTEPNQASPGQEG